MGPVGKGISMEAVEKIRVNSGIKKSIAVGNQWAHLIVILLAIILILPGLGDSSLRDWDEAIYAQVGREVIQSGDWISLSHGYRPYFEKPPLLMWMIAASYKLFGVSEFSARLPAAIAGIFLVWVMYLTGSTMYGNRTGFLAALILLSSYGFVYHTRSGTTNMPLSLFVFTGMFAYLRLRNGNQKWWYLILSSCALAFMMKFWAGLVLPAVLAIMLFLDGKIRETLHSRHFWQGLLLAALIVAPWHIIVYLRSGPQIIESYISRNLLQRTFTPLEGHHGTSLFYLDVLRQNFSPWFFLLPFAFAVGIKEMIDRQRTSAILIVQSLLVIGLYTFLVTTKIDLYILPVYPALCILVAYLFTQGSQTYRSNEFAYLITAAVIATAVDQNKILLLGVFVILGIVLLLRMGILQAERISMSIAGLIFFGFVVVGSIGLLQGNGPLLIAPIYGPPKVSPIAQIAAIAGEANSLEKEPLIGLAMEDEWGTPYAVEGPAASFYSNRPVDTALTVAQLESLMTVQKTGEIIIAEKYLERLGEEFKITVIEKIDPLVYARFIGK